jgi:dTDP-4-dehydrorhamnose reductase
MKILVTGRTGQLVTSLVERSLHSGGVEIVALGRPELDLESPAAIAEAVKRIGPDVVINAAAYTAVDTAEDEPERAFAANADGAGAVARAARAAGSRFVQISTDYVFDGTSDRPYREDDPVNPLGVYGRSKLAGEQAVRDEDGDSVVVRTAWVYSPFGRNFLKTMIAASRQRDELSVVADQVGNPSSALDLADGLLALAATWRQSPRNGLGETYHLTGGGEASWHGFAEEILARSARQGGPSARVRPIATDEWPTRAPRPRDSRLDSAKFERDFGYRAPPWQDSTEATVRRVLAAGA